MKKIVWLLMMVVMPMVMMPMVANAAFSRNVALEDEDELFHRLDQYIARRDEFSSKKEKKLIRMKKKLNLTSGKRECLNLYYQIYREYYTYRYDSAMVYANRACNWQSNCMILITLTSTRLIGLRYYPQAASTVRLKTCCFL